METHRKCRLLVHAVHCQSYPLATHLASPAVRALVPDAHRGEHHQPPPEAVREAPASSRLLLREVDQTETGEICIQ